MSDAAIEWARVAEPQSDGYDCDVTLDFARRATRLRALPVAEAYAFDGCVPVVGGNHWQAEHYLPAAADHHCLRAACDLVRQWPPVFRQCQRLLTLIEVVGDASIASGARGSTSGCGAFGFGNVCTTVYDPLGTAEAIVHEMAHHKLRALGIELESAQRLLTNAPDARYHSPIRYDVRRPMCAIVHAEYSYAYVIALELQVIHSAADRPAQIDVARYGLSRYIPKLEFGRRVIAENAQTDASGAQFLRGFDGWLERLFDEGRRTLAYLDVPPQDFVHPLGMP